MGLWLFGLCCGIFVACIYFWVQDREPADGVWHGWSHHYDVRHATRIFGVTENQIVKGRWCLSVVSLWKAHGYKEDYFLMEMKELTRDREVQPISRSQAIEFIMHWAEPDLARGLLRDWFHVP